MARIWRWQYFERWVKVLDFGLAKLTDRPPIPEVDTEEGTIFGMVASAMEWELHCLWV